MQEETEDGVGNELADELGDDEQVVVVHPDEVAGAVGLADLLGEGAVRLNVVLIVGGGLRLLGGDVLPEEVVE